MVWRLGLDVGSASIGWAAIELGQSNNPVKILKSGCRIFPNSRDPKALKSLAEQRRGPRGQRRNRDRYKKRRKEFMAKLVRYGLMPQDKAERKQLEGRCKGQPIHYETDPWVLRVKGLDEKIHLYELGRALFHLQQRRGFQSNRKADRSSSDDKGAIALGAQRTKEMIEDLGARTLGEALAQERVMNPKEAHEHPVRARPGQEGSKTIYDIYPLRAMIEQEFLALFKVQQGFHGIDVLTDTIRDDLLDTLLFQRPLKAQMVGKCSLNPEEQRAPSCLPSQQLLRIAQEVNHLRIMQPGGKARPLTIAERNTLLEKLKTTAEPSFTAMRKLISLPSDSYFNSESEKRKKLKGDQTAHILRADGFFGTKWMELSLQTQDALVELLIGCERSLPNGTQNSTFEMLKKIISKELKISEADSERLLLSDNANEIADWLSRRFDLPVENAMAVANAPSLPKWPQGHGRLGRGTSSQILPFLLSDEPILVNPITGEVYESPFVYSEAVMLAGFNSHSSFDENEALDALPYYGEVLERSVAFGTSDPKDPIEVRYGKIANPTVHVALNQLRKVVNKLVGEFGKPSEIIVETARDLPLSAEGRKELDRGQKKNQDKNENINKLLSENDVTQTYENRLKYRLWEELDERGGLGRCCPFSGDVISIERLFTDDVEIEHILPYSQTGDDSRSNKTLATRQANRDKGNKSPFEAFGAVERPGYKYDEIVSRASRMPANKKWRFNPDAMARFDGESSFQDRHLNDTRYIARLTRQYLTTLGADVWVTPGKLTSQLRHVWGLDTILAGHNQDDSSKKFILKNRNDHRHHAIDAIVIGLTDRAVINDVARKAALGWDEGKKAHKLLSHIDEPFEDFRKQVREIIEGIIVSHKADHGVQGQLHNDTAYGIIKETIDKTGKSKVVHRVPLADLDTTEKLEKIRDDLIREHLLLETEGLTGKEFIQKLLAVGEAMTPPVRRVRICDDMKVIPINSKRTGKPYKAYKGDGNFCYEIYANSKGVWTGELISRFEANQKRYDTKSILSKEGHPLIMRLHNQDMVEMNDPDTGQKVVFRVVKMSEGMIAFSKHFEANVDRRNRDKEDSFKYLTIAPSRMQKLEAMQVYVNEIGAMYKR